MANISTNTNCIIDFTDEEKEILQKASKICISVGKEIWHDGETDEEDEIAFLFSQIGETIKNILNKNYYYWWEKKLF